MLSGQCDFKFMVNFDITDHGKTLLKWNKELSHSSILFSGILLIQMGYPWRFARLNKPNWNS